MASRAAASIRSSVSSDLPSRLPPLHSPLPFPRHQQVDGIEQQAALAHALVDGRAVNEFDPAGKAAQEMTKLWQLAEEHLWPQDRRSAR
jgi:hypothetical protein